MATGDIPIGDGKYVLFRGKKLVGTVPKVLADQLPEGIKKALESKKSVRTKATTTTPNSA
jgi:hypothetical protein